MSLQSILAKKSAETSFPALLDSKPNIQAEDARAYADHFNEKVIPREAIPETDLIIIEQIYHNQLPDCGRKRGALLRYITAYKPAEAPLSLQPFNRIMRKRK